MSVKDIIREIKNQLAEKNINFLIGSGASVPYFPTLGNIEEVLTKRGFHESVRHLIYLYYFNEVVSKNLQLRYESEECENAVTSNYRRFIRGLINIMNYRNPRISPRRANIFTTNYDLFFEKAIDIEQRFNSSIILNDGGNGYFFRVLSSDNFHKTVSRNGVFDNYQNELPTINLIKCHGSVNWHKSILGNQEIIEIENDLRLLCHVNKYAKNINLNTEEKNIIHKYLTSVEIDREVELNIHEIAEVNQNNLDSFFKEYRKLMIINPEKSKFKNTVLDEYYYSMLRLLSYELEREQTILIVFGFSFRDEHIRNLIKRSLYNPYLRIYIFAYKRGQRREFEQLMQSEFQKNIVIIEPTEKMPPIDLNLFTKILFEDGIIDEYSS